MIFGLKSKAKRQLEQMLELTKRATECEVLAAKHEEAGEFYQAGKFSGQAKIYNMWVSTILSSKIK